VGHQGAEIRAIRVLSGAFRSDARALEGMLPGTTMGFERKQATMNHAWVRYSVGVFAGVAIWTAHGPVALAAPDASAESPAPTTWAEKKAVKLSNEALAKDYAAGHHDAAEKKIREGIQICMVQKCSDAIQARLHRDLGVVYIAGMKHVEDGKDEFAAALKQDPAIALTSASAEIPAVKQAFDEVKNPPSESKPESPKPEPELAKQPEEKKPEEKAKEPEPKPAPAEPVAEPLPSEGPKEPLRNWVSLGIQEDFVLHSAATDVCGSNSDYKCYNGYGRRQPAYNPGSYVPGGNQMSGGLQPGTLRVLAGYDRLIGRRFTAGVRLGAMIQGRARITQGDSAVMQYHAEARAALWFGHDPFNALLRPYIFVSGGLAETDSKVVVELQQTDPKREPCASTSICAFDAWKRSGMGFVGGGAGLMAAVTKTGGPNAELRYLQYFGPNTPAIALQIGYMLGF
jgi:hypothetical protein